ncbi:ABC transporter permease [Saccharopolyspora ipomoeae]|nr:ABC transporter permease [Saccharopolyspora sp. TS4A08]
MVPFAAVLAIAAAGQTLVIQQRGLDLSVPGNISLAAVTLGVFHARNGTSLAVTLGVVAAVAVVVGLANGLLVAKLAITPLISTLAVNALLLGALQAYSGGSPATAPPALSEFVSTKFLGQQVVVWVALLVVVVLAVLARKTVAGRRFVAVGANPSAARAAGVAVNRYVVGAYVVGSLCMALAGVLLAGYLKTTATTVGDPYLLPVIAAVIIGGTPLTGGRGSVVASAVAALFLSQLGQLVLTLGAPSSIQILIQAVAIAVAAVLRGIGDGGARVPWLRRVRGT